MKNFIKGFMASTIMWFVYGACFCIKDNVRLRKELNEALMCQKTYPHKPYFYKKCGHGPSVNENEPKNPIGFC